MPASSTAVLFEHQPREHRVVCTACRARRTGNDHAICDTCIDDGAPVTCSQHCRDLHRALAAGTRPAPALTPPRSLLV